MFCDGVSCGAAAAACACRTAFQLCNDVVTGTDFVDGNVDASELQAAYENGKKALDNQLVRRCCWLCYVGVACHAQPCPWWAALVCMC
jgi:sulfatase maturation enzyme AslB (radical SAM superfamily)